jgi:hypothetical protein
VTLWAEAIAELSAHLYHNNLFVYHFFNPIEYSLFAIMYFFLFDNWIIKKIILLSIIFYFPLSIYNSFLWEPFLEKKINSYAILAESNLLVLFSLLFYYNTIKRAAYVSVYRVPAFWVNTGILLFFSTNIFFWGYYNKMIHDDKDLHIFYRILFFENVILYILCGVSLFLTRSQDLNYKKRE